MKRAIFSAGVLLCLVVVLAGCGAGPTATPTAAAATPTKAAAIAPTSVATTAPVATPTSAPAATATTAPKPTATTVAAFELKSSAFAAGQGIPKKYSCDGQDVSPALEWTAPPQGTRSFALLVDDPDAPSGTWVHWVLFNIPADAKGLPEAMGKEATLASGARNGVNSGKASGYSGPCPPSGTHRYYFKLYALDNVLDLAAGASASQLQTAIQGHVLGQVQLMGTYSRN